MNSLTAGTGAVTTSSTEKTQRLAIPLLITLLLLAGAVAGFVYWPAFQVALSTWLHVLATIVMVGYFLFAGMIYLPVLERKMQADDLRVLLEQVSARLRPFFGGSLLIFLVTGTHLMMINRSYLGFGDFFGNPWSVLIVVKHVLVLAFLAVAAISERAFMGQISDRRPEALKHFHWALNIDAVLGAAILLLTSIAQAG